MKRNKLVFAIKENEDTLYLECNGGFDVGYMKPLQKDRDEIIKEFKQRVKLYDGILN